MLAIILASTAALVAVSSPTTIFTVDPVITEGFIGTVEHSRLLEIENRLRILEEFMNAAKERGARSMPYKMRKTTDKVNE